MSISELKDILDEKCRRDSGEWEGHFSGLKVKKYISEITHHTSFLNEYNPKLSERVYCIMNNIKDVVKCDISGKKMRFDSHKRGYLRSHGNYHKAKEMAVWKAFKNKDFNLLSREECINQFDEITCKYNDIVAYDNLNLTCSMLHYTQFLPSDKFIIPQRMYCIKNNINEILYDVNGNVRKFLNIVKGYQKHSNMNSYRQKSRERIKEFLERDNSIIGSHLREDGRIKHKINLKCNQCSHEYVATCTNGDWMKIKCPRCFNTYHTSKMEDCFYYFLKDECKVENIIRNDNVIVEGYELDLILPEYNLAFEVCGLPWHTYGTSFPSNEHKEERYKNRHNEKYIKCEEIGIQLLTIVDTMWTSRRKVLQNFIKKKLGIFDIINLADDCEIVEVEGKDSKRFLAKNHIEGKHVKFDKSIGLKMSGELVYILCFNIIDNGIQVICWGDRINTQTDGAFSKILKHLNADAHIDTDLRYYNGDFIVNRGGILLENLPPKIWHTYNKYTLEKYPKNMDKFNDGEYRRFYDCGWKQFLIPKAK